MRLAPLLALLLALSGLACSGGDDTAGGGPWRLEPTNSPVACEAGPSLAVAGAQFILVDGDSPTVRVWAWTCCWPVHADPVVVIESLDGRSHATELLPVEDFFGEMRYDDATMHVRPEPSRLTVVLPETGSGVVRPRADCLDLGAPRGAIGDSVLLLRRD
jgi:hypothetical protein